LSQPNLDDPLDNPAWESGEVVGTKYPAPSLSPEGFELLAKKFLDAGGVALSQYQSNHREVIKAHDGAYEFDVTTRFSAHGFDYLTLVECKAYKSPVKREKVQELWAKLQSVGAQKAVLFSTSGFQSGAIKFAKSHGVALVHLADGRTTILAKAFCGDDGIIPLDMVPDDIPTVVGWLINGTSASVLSDEDGRRLSDAITT
jgi:restriction system protein